MSLGTETIDKAILTLGDIVMAFEDHLADDGKIRLNEVASTLISEGGDIISVITNAATLKAELQDWTPEEREASLQKFINKFDLDNDKAERAIEKLLTAITNIAEFVDITKE